MEPYYQFALHRFDGEIELTRTKRYRDIVITNLPSLRYVMGTLQSDFI